MTAGSLTQRALGQLEAAGLSEQQWERANWGRSATWQGDRCGCPDDRCIGYHHYGEDDCGCLQSLLADWLCGDPYRFFAFRPPGPVCRTRRIGGYNRQRGMAPHLYASEARLTPRQRRRVRRKFNRTWL
jgi:hypothetical protein